MYEPSYMRGSVQGVPTHFYINGDGNFAGKKVLFNNRRNRNFISCLDHLTDSLKPSFGAVRNIYTPVGGHRVNRFDDISPEGKYVAAGIEGFKRFPYTAIDPHPKRRPPINYNDVEPVYHSKRLVSGRIKRARTQSIIIRCWPNGDEVNEPKRILLTCWMQRDLDVVCNAVTERCRDKVTRPISMIYTREGTQVKDADQLEHMRGYVALTHKEKFLKVKYKDASMKNLLTSPRLERRTLPPLMGSRGSKISTKHSSPDHSYASHPGSENSYSQRYRKNYHPRREEDTLFHGRPVAHKRSSDRPQRTRDPHIDFDQDEGGVFRAKGENRATKGAKEVNDTGDTKVDLPIDQVPAEEVTDEDDNRGSQDEKTAPVPSGMELTKLPSEQYDSIKMEEEEEEEKPRGKQNSNNNSYHANGYQANSYQANSRKTQNPRYKANSKIQN